MHKYNQKITEMTFLRNRVLKYTTNEAEPTYFELAP